MNTIQTAHIRQEKPNKTTNSFFAESRRRIYKPQKEAVILAPEDTRTSLKSASIPAKKMFITIVPIIMRHGIAHISQKLLGRKVGHHERTMSDAGTELHDRGLLVKYNQGYDCPNFTCCDYKLLNSCMNIELIEELFYCARELKMLSFFMLFSFKKMLQIVVTPLLFNSNIYESLSDNVNPSKRETFYIKRSPGEETSKKIPPKLRNSNEVLTSKSLNPPTRGKAMHVNNAKSSNEREIPRSTSVGGNMLDFIANFRPPVMATPPDQPQLAPNLPAKLLFGDSH